MPCETAPLGSAVPLQLPGGESAATQRERSWIDFVLSMCPPLTRA